MVSRATAEKWMADAEADVRVTGILKEVEASYDLGVRIIEGTEWHRKIKDTSG
jgi:hypothetical protein